MKTIKGKRQLLAEGQQLELEGRPEEAAASYQRVADDDPENQQAINRLLLIYRRLKEYKKELAVIDATLNAVAQRDKLAQQKWVAAHPGAAKLGKDVLKKLGGQSVTAYGTDPLVEKLLRRKTIVEKKIHGGKNTGSGTAPKAKSPKKGMPSKTNKDKHQQPAKSTRPVLTAIRGKVKNQQETIARKEEETQKKAIKKSKRELAAEKREKEAAARKEARAKKEIAAEEKRKQAAAIAEKKKLERTASREENRKKTYPSLFVVTLRYLVALERIDAAMEKHVGFLNKHFSTGEFLVSGRQVPRTGGVILVRAKNRETVERIMKQDPFLKGKLASVDIVEFSASKVGKGLEGLLD